MRVHRLVSAPAMALLIVLFLCAPLAAVEAAPPIAERFARLDGERKAAKDAK